MREIFGSNSVEEQIYNCLNINAPASFFLFAGAGSGKTGSLVSVLTKFKEEYSEELRHNGQRVAIITYTKAARDEIIHRLDYDVTFVVSTIHGFAWELIKPYQQEIKECLINDIQEDIDELELKQTNGRQKSKAWYDREIEIKTKRERLKKLPFVKKISYNPNTNNLTKDSLNHSEVIKITAKLLCAHSLLQKILIHTFPILLIDESQDTHKEMIDAFFSTHKNYPDKFSLGLFGDMMQRVYLHGKEHLGENLPQYWVKPQKNVNHRCSKRIIKLINKIRMGVEIQPHIQIPSETNEEGFVRLFIIDDTNIQKKDELEFTILEKMADITSDEEWRNLKDGVKILTLEHHMAARRGNFDKFFIPLYSVKELQTGILDGTLPEIYLFTELIKPLISAMQTGDKFLSCKIAMDYSPLLDEQRLKNSSNPLDIIKTANDAVTELYSLWDNGNDPKLIEILKTINKNNLFEIPDDLKPIAVRNDDIDENPTISSEKETDDEKIIDAWDEALNSSYSQFINYSNYISNNSRFGTHQGVKGLEFPRVMVIIDDEEARGFLFSYEKLFGAKEPTSTDIKNEIEGKETSFERTCRLFYVTCSRAKKSLAIVAYTKKPQKVKERVLSQGWFTEEELIKTEEIMRN